MSNFNLNRISDTEPMINDPFFEWINTFNKRELPKHPINVYLESVGFKIGSDKLTENDYNFLKHVLDHSFYAIPEYKENCIFSELFTPDRDGFYIFGKSGRYNASKKLLNIVNNSGLIYDCTPNNIYFELNGGRLYARYQTILGSRFICNINKAHHDNH